MNGHAVEARVYAEDPAARVPADRRRGARGCARQRAPGCGWTRRSPPGVTVTSDYDPMLAKVAAWGPDRATALRRLDAALAGTVVLGVGTNVAFLRDLLGDPDVIAGRLDTGLVERRISLAPRRCRRRRCTGYRRHDTGRGAGGGRAGAGARA